MPVSQVGVLDGDDLEGFRSFFNVRHGLTLTPDVRV
jgi:hypothetical protein